MSTITQPVTQNYIYQTMISALCTQKDILANGVTPNTDLFLQLHNNNYETLRDNQYKYNFVYNFLLSDFINSNTDTIKRTEVISHDQMTLNFDANLIYFNGFQNMYRRINRAFQRSYIQYFSVPIYKTATIGYLYDSPISATNYSKQYSTTGITLRQYMQTVITELPNIVNDCPVDLNIVQEYYPQNYIYEYNYTDLLGNTTKKTASFTAIKYTNNGIQKVLFFGTGLQEFVQP
jgi:hypothetical protein